MTGTPFPVNPVLTGLLVAYRNNEYIADQVLPRLQPLLPREKFSWWKFDFTQDITLKNTQVGRKSRPGTAEFYATEQNDRTNDYGLDGEIPNSDVMNATGSGYDPEAVTATRVYDLILLDREKRVADLVHNSATYPAANVSALSGASKWSNTASTPISAFTTAADSMVMRPNIAVMGRGAYTALRTNQQVLRAISVSGTSDGMASKAALCELLELEDILVGESWLNSAKPGQTPTRIRLWGNNCALLRRDKLAGSDGQQATFGWTAQFGTPVSGSIDDPDIGLRGGKRVRSGESVKEVISAPDLGYLFTGVV